MIIDDPPQTDHYSGIIVYSVLYYPCVFCPWPVFEMSIKESESSS